MSLRRQTYIALVVINLSAIAGATAFLAPPHSQPLPSEELPSPNQQANVPSVEHGLQWETIDVPTIGRVRVAMARPSGPGPFQAVVILHGTHGFAREYLDLARDLARGGVLAVAVCWFSGGSGQGKRLVTPVDCAEGTPAMPLADSEQAFATIDAVVRYVRALPDSRDNQVALFGHSRGGGAVRNYLLRDGNANAGVMSSAGYPASPDLSHLNAPLLILHGTADAPADGGSAYTNIKMARAFEVALRAKGKPVEAHYYRGGTHNGLFVSGSQRRDEVRRILRFIRRLESH